MTDPTEIQISEHPPPKVQDEKASAEAATEELTIWERLGDLRDDLIDAGLMVERYTSDATLIDMVKNDETKLIDLAKNMVQVAMIRTFISKVKTLARDQFAKDGVPARRSEEVIDYSFAESVWSEARSSVPLRIVEVTVRLTGLEPEYDQDVGVVIIEAIRSLLPIINPHCVSWVDEENEALVHRIHGTFLFVQIQPGQSASISRKGIESRVSSYFGPSVETHADVRVCLPDPRRFDASFRTPSLQYNNVLDVVTTLSYITDMIFRYCGGPFSALDCLRVNGWTAKPDALFNGWVLQSIIDRLSWSELVCHLESNVNYWMQEKPPPEVEQKTAYNFDGTCTPCYMMELEVGWDQKEKLLSILQHRGLDALVVLRGLVVRDDKVFFKFVAVVQSTGESAMTISQKMKQAATFLRVGQLELCPRLTGVKCFCTENRLRLEATIDSTVGNSQAAEQLISSFFRIEQVDKLVAFPHFDRFPLSSRSTRDTLTASQSSGLSDYDIIHPPFRPVHLSDKKDGPLLEVLDRFNLEHEFHLFADMGVRSVEDLHLLEESMLETLRIKPLIEKKIRLMLKYLQQKA